MIDRPWIIERPDGREVADADSRQAAKAGARFMVGQGEEQRLLVRARPCDCADPASCPCPPEARRGGAPLDDYSIEATPYGPAVVNRSSMEVRP